MDIIEWQDFECVELCVGIIFSVVFNFKVCKFVYVFEVDFGLFGLCIFSV